MVFLYFTAISCDFGGDEAVGGDCGSGGGVESSMFMDSLSSCGFVSFTDVVVFRSLTLTLLAFVEL